MVGITFATIFKDIRHELSLIFSLSLTNPDIMKQNKLTNFGKKEFKKLLQKFFTNKTKILEKI